MVICKAHEILWNEAHTVRRSDAAIGFATMLGDCHASLATSAAGGRFSTAS
jgi:hypothetical protein